ncbi:MAG: aspartate aminotransferase family protein [Ardenticatenaceae bacterium]|nr:aspartate aminotransferase family protein [Ardenticatenaceae bacterium]
MSNNESTLFSTNALPTVAWGKGSYVVDRDGKKYLDGSGGPAVYCLGHSHEEVNEAIKAQLDRIAHGYRYNFTSEPLEELQAIVAQRSGGGLNQTIFVTSGSEAVESCLKIALQYHDALGEKSRRHFIARQRSWHGNTLGALSVSGHVGRRRPFEGSLLDVSFMSPANAYRPPAGLTADDIADYCAAELEQEILRLGPETVSAFIFEPVVGAAGGVVPAPPNYARRMLEVCHQYGVLMIADEVMCGCGRTGTWRALAFDGVEPDIMSIAKGLAGGYIPLGAAVFQEHIGRTIIEKQGQYLTGHTFSGHTAACAAGVAVQKIVERDKLVEKAAQDGQWLLAALRAELGDHPHVGDIRGRGFFVGVEFVADRGSKRPFDPALNLFGQIRAQTLANGLICYPVGGIIDGYAGDAVILAPPYNASGPELEEVVDKLVVSCRTVLAGK